MVLPHLATRFFNSNEALDQKLDLKTIGLPFLVIYIVSDVGSVFFGWLSSRFLRMGWSLNRARKTTLFIYALCVVPISLASTTHSIYVAVALISLATAAHTGWAANMYTFAADLFPRSGGFGNGYWWYGRGIGWCFAGSRSRGYSGQLRVSSSFSDCQFILSNRMGTHQLDSAYDEESGITAVNGS